MGLVRGVAAGFGECSAYSRARIGFWCLGFHFPEGSRLRGGDHGSFGLGRWIFDSRLCICFRRGIRYATGCAMVLWVFGYGSLIWNLGFDFDDKILGFIKGYNRTFNLGMDACFAGACLGLGTPSLTRTSASTSSLVLFPTPAACIDHRGTPEHPARTCTLETDDEAICVRNQPLCVYPYFPCLQCSCCEDELSSFYCRW